MVFNLLPERLEDVLSQECNVGVLVVDIQESYKMCEGKPRPGFLTEIPRQIEILEYSKTLGIPVWFVELFIRGDENDPTLEEISNAVACYEKLSKIVKTTTNPFRDTSLEQEVCDHGVNTFLLMGFNPQICVSAAAFAAGRRGINIISSPTILNTGTRLYQSKSVLPWYELDNVRIYQDILDD